MKTTNVLTQQILDDLILNIKSKYRNIIYDLRLECRTGKSNDSDDIIVRECAYISLVFIGIKKSQRQKGYGSKILSEVIVLADTYNVPIKLWVTDIFGIKTNILIAFYQRHGFVLIKKDKANAEDIMYYYPSIH